MEFITGQTRMCHTGYNGTWRLLDNQLFNYNGDVYIVPRNFYTDNYTIPNWIAWLGGSKGGRDVRPSHFHDFGCDFHAMVLLTVSLKQLREEGLLRERLCDDGVVRLICDDLPLHYLRVVKFSKRQVDDMLADMMLATGNITKSEAKKIRAGVFFNIGWLFSKHSMDYTRFYTGINDFKLKGKHDRDLCTCEQCHK